MTSCLGMLWPEASRDGKLGWAGLSLGRGRTSEAAWGGLGDLRFRIQRVQPVLTHLGTCWAREDSPLAKQFLCKEVGPSRGFQLVRPQR